MNALPASLQCPVGTPGTPAMIGDECPCSACDNAGDGDFLHPSEQDPNVND